MKAKRLLIALVAMMLPMMAYAQIGEEEIDGICYRVNHKFHTAEVIGKAEKYSGDIVIPSVLFDDYKILSIGSEAFRGCTALTSITIPNSVTSIGAYAFSNCTGLTSITIPNSVKTISHYAFSGSGLTSITIPNSVETIEWCAFRGCTGLTSVIIPSNVKTIEYGTFEGCSSLTSVTIPNSVETICHEAFNNCTGLTSVIIPSNVKTIEYGTFEGCSSLTSIKVKSDNVTYDSRDNCNAIIEKSSNTLIVGCKNTIIPSSVTSIGDKSFSNCTGLTSITIPNSVTSIGNSAFSGCSGLTSVTIPNSVETIGEWTFRGCTALTDVNLMGIIVPKTKSSAFIQNDIKDATLHANDYIIESLKGIEPWKWFKEFVCDEKVTDFNLTYYVDGEIYRTETHKYDDEIVPVVPTKKGFTFSGWDIDIPEKMPGKDVEAKGTFSWSKKTIDNVIYEVYDATNNYCKVIGNESASGAIKIADAVDFDDSYNVTAISDNAFNGCKNITSIEIPATVTTIGERAFANIDKLTDVTILATDLPEIDRTAFENSYINDYVTLHVPEASLEKYKTTAPWKNFKEVVGIAGPKKCATPTITFSDGKVKFSCETEGVTFKYEIKNADNFEGEGDEIEVGGVYNVSVYATKDDYIDSDKATMQIKLSTVKGDVNGDGKVDVSDHVELSNIIMGIHEEEAEVEQEETE